VSVIIEIAHLEVYISHLPYQHHTK